MIRLLMMAMATTQKTQSQQTQSPPGTAPSRAGVILVIVLVVVAVMALSAYTFTDLMLVHHDGAQTYHDMAQAQALTASAAASIRALLLQPVETRNQLGGLLDNPSRFENQEVVAAETEEFLGRFSVMAPRLDPSGLPLGVRYGLENESAKLNLNALLELFGQPPDAAGLEVAGPPAGGAGGSGAPGGDAGDAGDAETEPGDDGVQTASDALMQLPGMTPELADAILDWIDEDDEPREFGAERDYYGSLDPPYQPRNGPLQSLTELLLVRDVTPELLFGRDANRNGELDEAEWNAPLLANYDASLGSLDLGWLPYLTLYSRELPRDPLGLPRIDVNQSDMANLYAELATVLEEEWAGFIVAYRQNGPNDSDATGEAMGGRQPDLTQPGQTNIDSVLDLVGAQVRVRFPDQDQPVLIASPFPDEPQALANSLPRLLDHIAVGPPDQPETGKINVNHAPRPVLMAVPGMTAEVADQCLSQQSSSGVPDDAGRRHATWLLTEGLVDLDTMREMLPYVTAGGDVYRAQLLGLFGSRPVTSRVEVILDATLPDVPLLVWKSLDVLGNGLPSHLPAAAW